MARWTLSSSAATSGVRIPWPEAVARGSKDKAIARLRVRKPIAHALVNSTLRCGSMRSLYRSGQDEGSRPTTDDTDATDKRHIADSIYPWHRCHPWLIFSARQGEGKQTNHGSQGCHDKVKLADSIYPCHRCHPWLIFSAIAVDVKSFALV